MSSAGTAINLTANTLSDGPGNLPTIQFATTANSAISSVKAIAVNGTNNISNALAVLGLGGTTTISQLNFDGGDTDGTDDADTLTLSLVAGGNAVTVTPTSARSATIQHAASGLTVDASGLAPQNNRLVLTGGAGMDELTVVGSSHVDAFTSSTGLVAVTSDSVGRLPISYSAFESLTLNGLALADTFNVTPDAVAVTVNGGAPASGPATDSLTINSATDNVTHAFDATLGSGDVIVGSHATIDYTGLEKVNINGTGSATLTIAGSINTDVLTMTGTDPHDFDLNFNGALASYAGIANFDLTTLAGDDQVSVTPFHGAGGWDVALNLDLGTGAADSLSLFGDSAQQTIEYLPRATTNQLQINGGTDAMPTPGTSVTIAGIESLSFDGQGGHDSVTVTGTGALTIGAGVADDAGTATLSGKTPLAFSDLGSGGSVTFATDNNGATADRLILVGTSNVDAFQANATTAQLNSRLTVSHNLTSSEVVELVGGQVGDEDSATLTATANADTLSVQTNNNSGTVTGVGPIIALTRIELVTLDGGNGANNFTLSGTSTIGEQLEVAFVGGSDCRHVSHQQFWLWRCNAGRQSCERRIQHSVGRIAGGSFHCDVYFDRHRKTDRKRHG